MSEPVAVLEPIREQPAQENTSGILSPYFYPEFTSPGGERYLKKLLRQILPMSLYRTWEIFADHQARGNECYLSIPQLATLAGRSLRTMQKNMASLQAKHLLVERAERKAFRGRAGESTSRMVIVKDFTALYTLAHEYDSWLHAEAYIPPDRVFLSVLTQEAELVAKLRRFDNYRRVLYTQLPGSGPQAHKEDRWFTQYPSQEPTTAEEVDQEGTSTARNTSFLPPKEPSKEMSKATLKRKNESSHRDVPRRDSFDSASSFSDKSLRKEGTGSCPHQDQSTISNPSNEQGSELRAATQQATKLSSHALPEQQSEHTRRAPVREREETSQEVQMTRQAMATISHSQRTQRSGQAHDRPTSPPRPSDHPLARSFLNEIAVPFGDRNLKGSTTRVLGIIVNAHLEEAEVLLCLVRAYVIARDTHTVRSIHYDQQTGRANRMPLFCTLFERFIQARFQNGKWNYSYQQMEDDLAADDRLLLWWTEHQALVTTEMPDSYENQSVSAPDAQEDPHKVEEEFPRIVGWASQEAAHAWGEQLLEALVVNGYEAEVRVHLESQWYQLVLLGEGCELVLETPEQVQLVIEQVCSGML